MGALKVALIGTGLMGAPMAANIAKAGFPVTVWNRAREKAEPLKAHGIAVADTIPEAVKDADVIITMVSDGPTVRGIYFDAGAAAAARTGATFVDMSSIAPSIARELAARLKEMGLKAIDAPVSGGTVGAREATLAIMAGGEEADIAAVLPVLKAMGRVTRVGPSGAGQLSKLVNQSIVAVTIGVIAEGLLLAEAGGADPAAVRDAIRGGFAESRILELHGARMLARDFVPGGPSRLQLKDLDAVADEAKSAGVTLPLVENVRARFATLVREMGLTEVDHSGLLLQLEAMNKPHRVGDVPDKLPG